MFIYYPAKKMGRSREPPVNKGVGGYRPTINWRDISIRRKNMADKQVLACIVISGVIIIIVGVVLTVLGFLVIKSQCPFDWVSGAGSCYYFAQHNASWESGKEYCEDQGTDLLDLHSSQEESFVVGKMQGRSWLGLNRKKGDSSFVWVSGSKLNFTQGEISLAMDTVALAKECGVIEESGEWMVSPCDDKGMAFVICEYVPTYNPFMLVGPVVIFCGVVLLLLSVEVCVRRREFLENNPEVLNDDDDRQVDEGLVNYGYGHFESDEDVSDASAMPPKVSWPVVGDATPTKTARQDAPGNSGNRQVSPVEDAGSGPVVHVVPASVPTSPSLATIPHEDHTQSQEHLELLLSPKTLE
ncbi:uncharacterized protein [Macrobrachium rosenbergii]|uniref:uncharacterized protein isoform X1 n=1 Tax=Macrobrachium rosenbergii TaxID=79674 RepID=UPI0034D6A670